MAYTLNLSLLDLGGYYSAGFPTFAGTIVDPARGSAAVDTAASNTAVPLTLAFASAAAPPATASATLVLDTGTTGDLVRTGIVATLPPSPGTATVITVPPVVIPAATIVAAAAGAAIPPTMVPGWIRWIAGILTAGTYIPLVAVLPPPVVTLGSGTITVTVTGSLAVRVAYFFVSTTTVTVTATVTPAPSNDPLNPLRIVRTPQTTASLLSAAAFIPGLGFFLAAAIASTVESSVNSTIVSTARSMVAGMGMRFTPSAVLNARRITVVAPAGGGAGGVNLQLGVSDLFGGAIVPLTRSMAVAISPTPTPATTTAYAVTVTDVANGSPIANATLTLRNYDAAGTAQVTTYTTDPMGRAVMTVSLRTKQTYIVVITQGDDGKPERERELATLHPTLTADANGYNRVITTLL